MTMRRARGRVGAQDSVPELTGSEVWGVACDYALTGQNPISGLGRSPGT